MGLTAALPTTAEMRDDFDNQRYKDARKKADILFRYGRESEYRLASDVCSAAYDHFMMLARKGERKQAERLMRMFPECRFDRWLPGQNHKFINHQGDNKT